MENDTIQSERSLMEAFYRLARNMRRRPAGQQPHARGRAKLLGFIALHDGAGMGELASMLDIRTPSLGEVLAKLEADGLVRRTRDENDFRVVRVYLSQAGREFLENTKNDRLQEDDFSDILSDDERVQLRDLCEKLSRGLEKRASPGAEEKDDRFAPRNGRHEAHFGDGHACRENGAHNHGQHRAHRAYDKEE